MKEFTCPRCGRSLDSQARYCQHCGVDLAIAAVLAEQNVAPSTGQLIGAPLTPELLVPRLGTYLMEKGVLDSDGLNPALAYQEQKSQAGSSILLGQALVELGLVDREVFVWRQEAAKRKSLLNLQNINLREPSF